MLCALCSPHSVQGLAAFAFRRSARFVNAVVHGVVLVTVHAVVHAAMYAAVHTAVHAIVHTFVHVVVFAALPLWR